MKIRIKLYAMLAEYLPADAVKNEADLDLPDATSVADTITQLRLPEKFCHLVLVNGVYVAPGDRASHPLKDGDHLAIWPPVAGG